MGINKYLPHLEELLEKNLGDKDVFNNLNEIIGMYKDVANKIEELNLNIDDPNRFYDGEPDMISMDLNDKNIEHFSKMVLRMLNDWSFEKEYLDNKDYKTREDKININRLKQLIWPLEAQINNTSMMFSKYKDDEVLIFSGENTLHKEERTIENESKLNRLKLFSDYSLHPIINRVAYGQFIDGYYKEAILNSFIEVIDQVKKKSGNPKKQRGSRSEVELDGEELMQKVFGCENQEPIIKFNDLMSSLDKSEQRGIMNLFKGIVGIRNKKAHLNFIQPDPTKTMEYLAFASLLIRLLNGYSERTL